MKKLAIGLITGAAMLLVNIIVGQIFHYFVPSIQSEYNNQNIFRPWSDPLMSLMLVHPFLVGIILAWLWYWVKDIVPGDGLTRKGINFCLIYTVISIPGMLISYGTFPVSFMLILSWTVGIFFEALCAGIMFSKLLK